ncbi:XRE family transcriptional regulator [Desulfoplanes sp. PS50]
MTNNFSKLREKMSPEVQERVESRTKNELIKMRLDELRKVRGLSQKELSVLLHVQQPAVAKLEKRTDMYISSLRNHIEALGGKLEIVAKFPDGSIQIDNFSDLNNNTSV